MMRALFIVVFLLAPLAVSAAEQSVPYHFDVHLGNQASLQRGAKLFMNYCSGCHSLKYMRYRRIADDLDIPDDVMENHLMMTHGKIGDTIDGTMPKAKASDWLGKAPPDLSLVARNRGADWIYSFLLTFYLDDAQPSGVNNVVYPKTAMPAVVWPLQGFQKLEKNADDKTGEGEGEASGPHFKLVQKGKLNPAQYRVAAGDLTNFLVYVGEPARLKRFSIGWKVILFLLVFTVLAYLLKREFWRDVH